MKNTSVITYNFYHLLWMFFIFSMIGWLWEVLIHLFYDQAFINRGVLLGPWLPIYGSGGVLIVMLSKKLYYHPVLLFFSIMITCGILEYTVGWALETFLGTRWWDYRGYFLNIQGRVCLIGLLVFGLGGCLAVYYLLPKLKQLLDKLSPNQQRIIALSLAALFVIDLIYSTKNPNTGTGITFPVSGFIDSTKGLAL